MLRPVSKWLYRGLAAGLAGLTVLLAMLFWRLATAGLSLSFVTPYVNAALQDAVPGYQVAIGDTELYWQGIDAPIGVLASDVRVAAAGGGTAVTIPRLHLDFAMAPLLDGSFDLTRVEADGALLNLTRNAAGELGLAVMADRPSGPADGGSGTPSPTGPDGAGGDGAEGLGASADPERDVLLARIAGQLLQAPAKGGALANLASVGVTGSQLIVDDAISGRSWQAQDVRLMAARDPTGIVLRGEMDMELGGGRTLPIGVSAFHRQDSNALDARVTGGPVYPAELAGGPMPDWLLAVDAPLLFEIGFRFDGASVPAEIDGRITGAIGRLRLPDLAPEPLPLSDLELRFKLQPQAQRIEIGRFAVTLAGAELSGRGGLAWSGRPLEPLTLAAAIPAAPRLESFDWRGRIGPIQGMTLQRGRLHLSNPAAPQPPRGLPSEPRVSLDAPLDVSLSYRAAPLPAGGSTGPGGVIRAEMTTAGAHLGLPGKLDRPLAFDDVSLGLRYDRAAARLEVGHAALRVNGIPASVNGTLQLAPDDATLPGWRHLTLEADLGSMTLPQVMGLWPADLVPPTRDWFDANLEQAVLQAPRMTLDIAARDLAAGQLPEGSIDIRFGLVDAVLHYLRPMAPILNLSAAGRLTESAFRLTDATGALEGVRLSGGTVTIAGLQDGLPLADIRYRAEGSIGAMLRALNQKPLELPRRIDLAPETIGGNGSLDVQLAFPLRADLTADDIAYGVTGPLKGVEMKQVIGDIDLSRGMLQFSANRDGLEAKGEARLAGVPAVLEWRQPVAAGKPARYRIKAQLDAVQRQRWGIEVDPFVTGLVAADFTFLEIAGGGWEMGASLDLERARLTLPALHVDKPTGMPASAALRGTVDGTAFRSLEVDNLVAPGLGVTAKLELQDGKVARIDLSRLEIGETLLSGWAKANPSDIWSVFLQGETADLRPYLDGLAAGLPEARRAGPYRQGVDADLVLNVTTAILADDFVTRDLAMDMALRQGTIERLQGQTQLPPGSGAVPGTLRLRVARDGQSLRFALNSDDAGASFRSIGFDKLSGGNLVAVGTAPVTDPGKIAARAVVQNTRIVDVPDLEALVAAPRDGDGSGRTAGSGVPVEVAELDLALDGSTLLVRDLRARGPDIGITLQGEIGLEVNRAALTGTFVPAYALNNAFGRIPIIGDLLIGREGEGLIGFTFRVSGPLDRPEVEVNPLSGLAPGFLRRLFEFTPPDLGGPDG